MDINNLESFDNLINESNRTDYIPDDVLEFFCQEVIGRTKNVDSNPNVVIKNTDDTDKNKSDMRDEGIDPIVNLTRVMNIDNIGDDELFNKVMDKIEEGLDKQYYQFRPKGKPPRGLEIWRTGNGCTVFVISEKPL